MLPILSRLALKHDLEIRELQAATFRTMLVKHDELLMQASKAATGLFVTKSKEGQRPPGEPHVNGLAAMMTALTTDTALSAEDKQKVAACTSSANSPEILLQSIYWSQLKKHVRRTGSSGSVPWTPRLSHILCLIIKAMKARGAKEKFGQAPAGGNVRELQQMLDDLLRKMETRKGDSNCGPPGYDRRCQELDSQVRETAEEDRGCSPLG